MEDFDSSFRATKDLDMSVFIREYEKDPVDMKSLKVRGVTNQQIVDKLKKIYREESY